MRKTPRIFGLIFALDGEDILTDVHTMPSPTYNKRAQDAYRSQKKREGRIEVLVKFDGADAEGLTALAVEEGTTRQEVLRALLRDRLAR